MVYIIQSINFPKNTYIGYTTNINKRLQKHNQGGSYHTSKYKPWKLLYFSAFATKKLALDFEKYLKSSSGKAFTRKRLIGVKKGIPQPLLPMHPHTPHTDDVPPPAKPPHNPSYIGRA